MFISTSDFITHVAGLQVDLSRPSLWSFTSFGGHIGQPSLILQFCNYLIII